jgi:hypothetical protein
MPTIVARDDDEDLDSEEEAERAVFRQVRSARAPL